MSTPLGGFNFGIGFITSRATQALQALQAQGQQTAQGIQQAFQQATPQVNVAAATANLNAAAAAVANIKSQGEIKITLRGDGIDTTVQQVNQLSQTARALAGQRLTVNISGNAEQAMTAISQVRQALDNANKGERVNIQIRASAEQAEQALRSLEQDLKAAEQREVKVHITVDTAGIEQEAAQAATRAARAAESAKRQAEQQARQQARQQSQADEQIKINVSVQGAQVTATELARLQQAALQIGQRPVTLTVNAQTGATQQEIARIRQQLQQMGRGDATTINIRADPTQAEKAIRQLEQDIDEVKKRGGTVVLNVDTRQAEQQVGIFQRILAGGARGAASGSGLAGDLLIGQGITSGAAAAGLGAAIAVKALTEGIKAAIAAGIEYNKVLEQNTNTFQLFTGSAVSARQAMAGLRQLAAVSPFGEQQVTTAGASFLRTSGGDVQRMQELTQLTVVLAAAHPERGFEEMQQAIQQLISGDYRAFEDRTNIAFGSVRELAKQGFSGMELYRKAVEQAGGSTELLNKNAQSFQARITTLESSLQSLNAAAGRGIFEGLSGTIGELNSVLAKHQDLWNQVAEATGRAANQAIKIMAINAGFSVDAIARLPKDLDAAASALERAGATKPDSAILPQTPRQVAITANRTEQEQITSQQSIQKANLEEIDRRLRANANSALQIKTQYELQLIPLRAQIALIEQAHRNPALQFSIAVNNLAQVRAQQSVASAQGDPGDRADAAGKKVLLDQEQELLQIRQRRAQISIQLAAQERALVQQAAQEELRVRGVALERLRDEARAHAEVRALALERLRDEIQGHQAARQASLDKLREEATKQQEVRQLALQRLQDEIKLQQQARQDALEALREQIRVQQQVRSDALDALRETIRVRRDAYQQEKEQQDELARAAEQNWQRAEQAADRAHQASQERYRAEIQALQDRNQRLTRQEQGPTPAEKELKAFEEATRERARAQSLLEAEANVRNAMTGRERRQAQYRLESLKVEQLQEREKEELQARAQRQRDAIQAQQQKRQEEIAALERRAQDEDRAYQHEKQARDDAHQRDQEALQAKQRAEDRAEKEKQRAEDAQVRALEVADRLAQRAEQEKVRQQELADKAAQRAADARVRALEESNRAADRASQDKIAQQERANRELDRKEAESLRAAEAAAKAADRAEEHKVRAEERSLEAAQRAQDAKDRAAARVDALAALQMARDAATLELKQLELRERVLKMQDIAALAAATRDLTLSQIVSDTLGNLQKATDLLVALQTLNYQQQVQALEAEETQRLVDLNIQRVNIEADISSINVALDVLQARLEELKRQQTGLMKPPPEDKGAAPTLLSDPVGAAKGWLSGFTEWLGNAANWVLGLTEAVGGLSLGWENALKNDKKTLLATQEWTDTNIIGAVQDRLEVKSPSALSARWAGWIIDGFLGPLVERGPEVSVALEAPFIGFEDNYLPAFNQKLTELADQAYHAFADAWSQSGLTADLEAPFIEFQDQYLDPAFKDKMATRATDAATAWKSQWDLEARALVDGLEAPFIEFEDRYLPEFNRVLTTRGTEAGAAFIAGWEAYDVTAHMTVRVPDGFEAFGKAAGAAFCRGWSVSIAACPCPDCSVPAVPAPGPGGPPNAKYPNGIPPGGPAQRGAESILPVRQVGAVVPAGAVDFARRSSGAVAAAGSSSVVNSNRGPVQLAITNHIVAGQGEDTEALADRITARTVDKIIDILDYTQNAAPDPVSRILPGAL